MKTRRWDFISDNCSDFGVQRLCRVLGVSRSGFYRYRATAPARSERQAAEGRAVAEIRSIHAEHHGAYGAPRVHAALRSRGRKINRKRVARLMRVNHIVGRHLRRKKRTTIADKTAPAAPDLLMRDFSAEALNTKWCGDITYIAVGSTWLYLATVIDICSRRVIGWSIADHMRASLVTDAIERAVAVRGGPRRWRRLPHGQGSSIRQPDLRRRLPTARHPPQHGTRRIELRQCAGRVVLPGPQAGVAPRTALDFEGTDEARAIPLARLLQPTPTALRPWLPHTDRVRTAADHINYAVTRRMNLGVHSRGSTSRRRAPACGDTAGKSRSATAYRGPTASAGADVDTPSAVRGVVPTFVSHGGDVGGWTSPGVAATRLWHRCAR